MKLLIDARDSGVQRTISVQDAGRVREGSSRELEHDARTNVSLLRQVILLAAMRSSREVVAVGMPTYTESRLRDVALREEMVETVMRRTLPEVVRRGQVFMLSSSPPFSLCARRGRCESHQ